MLKSIISIFCVLLGSLLVHAQSAKEWMDKVSNTYQKTPTYYIKFEVKESGSQKSEVGELFAAKEKYSLQVMDIHQIYDGKTLYTVSKEDKEVTISKPAADSDDFLTPTKVLSIYKSNFSSSLDKLANIGGKKIQYIKLKPNGQSDLSYVMVGINIHNNTIYEYKEYSKNGSYRQINVKEYLENLIIPRALFKFDQSKYEKDGYIVTSI